MQIGKDLFVFLGLDFYLRNVCLPLDMDNSSGSVPVAPGRCLLNSERDSLGKLL